MAQRTCGISGCLKPHVARGWCQGHYLRWSRYGDPEAGRPKRWAKHDLCSIEGCDAPARRRGWCGKHYQRWYVHGDAEYVVPRYETCTVAGCGQPTRSPTAPHCETHYYRQRRTGRLDLVSRRKAKPGYTAAHTRTRTDRGSASTYDCIDCGEQAAHWSFAWRRVDSDLWLWGEANGSWLAYTGHPADYDPRCHRCAKRYDKDFAREGWRQTRKEATQ